MFKLMKTPRRFVCARKAPGKKEGGGGGSGKAKKRGLLSKLRRRARTESGKEIGVHSVACPALNLNTKLIAEASRVRRVPIHIDRELVKGHPVGQEAISDDIRQSFLLVPRIPAGEARTKSIAWKKRNGARERHVVFECLQAGRCVGGGRAGLKGRGDSRSRHLTWELLPA